jgi:protein SCO1/2
VVGVGLLVLAGCADDEAELRGTVRTPPLEVSHVALPDAWRGGALATLRPPESELYVLYFGYTRCPDICPTTLNDIAVALEDLSPPLRERITVGMVTVDPERDTDEVLTGYLDHFFDRSLALRTADPAALAAAADAFGVQWEVEAHEPGDDDYGVGHTAVTYVVDDTGTVAVEWAFGLDSESMTSDLRALLRRDPP